MLPYATVPPILHHDGGVATILEIPFSPPAIILANLPSSLPVLILANLPPSLPLLLTHLGKPPSALPLSLTHHAESRKATLVVLWSKSHPLRCTLPLAPKHFLLLFSCLLCLEDRTQITQD
ncbi:hypothetical protein GLYMA_12G137750v4 [Glycine max]|nr:hypothetical protein GLYMA_12G137750v4 [Glycine max]KAH1143059.1 hypothetical protein GYH30_033659 [Glycine max]